MQFAENLVIKNQLSSIRLDTYSGNPKAINLLVKNAATTRFNEEKNKFANLNLIRLGELSADRYYNSSNMSNLKSKSLSDEKLFGVKKMFKLTNNVNKNRRELLRMTTYVYGGIFFFILLFWLF